ncbi:MAG: flagellar hook-associated protein FlgK [Defluviitaleaceae bacterium]|nr:flagellar hook-associated protein FlgK [Defluviitaleaceae bacterium]
MRGSFFTFRVATTGMHTARNNLNVTAHNVANIGIPGFSRQVTVQGALPAINNRDGRGMFGTGSAVTNVMQMRDQFIDRRFWSQNGFLGEFAVKVPQLSLIEAIFNDLPENSTVGVLGAFNDFFSRVQELTRESQDGTFRLNILLAGETLSQMVRSNAESLRQQQHDINGEVRAVVTEMNSIGSQIASLNEQIRGIEFSGSYANDLRDTRALLLDRLSELVNISVEERDFSATSGIPNDRRLLVQINGTDFVSHDTLHRLEVVPRTDAQRRNTMDVDGLYDVKFSGGAEFNIYSRTLTGTLKGLIDVRDGNATNATMVRWRVDRATAIDLADPTSANFDPAFREWLIGLLPREASIDSPNTWPTFINMEEWQAAAAPINLAGLTPVATNDFKGIPFYMNRLNEMIRVFVGAINDGVDVNGNPINGVNPGGHRTGYALNGDSGRAFFTWINPVTGLPVDGLNDRHLLNALNFDINSVLRANPNLLQNANDPTSGESDNSVILGFIRVGDYPSLFREGSLMDFVIATTSHLAIDSQQAHRFLLNYTEMTTATLNRRASISDPDMNEEMLNMERFRQLYTVNARMISTMNDIYDTLINRLGVG